MKVLFVNPPFLRYKETSPITDKHVHNSWRLNLISFMNRFEKFPHFQSMINRIVCFNSGLRFGVRAGSRWPFSVDYPLRPLNYPFIMGYATSYLIENGIQSKLIDCVAEMEFSYKRFFQKIKKENPDIVVIECSAPTIDIDMWVAKEISKFAEVAFAGAHLSQEAESLKKKCPYVKYFLKSEYIKSSLKMAKTRKPGIYEPEIVEDLDKLPYPYRDYPKITEYYDPAMPTIRPSLQIMGSKGCPFRCSFCMWPKMMYERKVSLRKPKEIAAEIKLCVKKYGFKSIFFDDDTFNVGNDRISELCDELKKIGLPWTMMGRLDTSPRWLLDKMVQSGCRGMRLGVETFDPEVLKNVGKGLERGDFVETLNYLSKKYPKLILYLTMMQDLPGQSEEAHKRDVAILTKMGFKEAKPFPHSPSIYRRYQMATCAPFPGTELYDFIVKKGKADFVNDSSAYDSNTTSVMKRLNKEIKNWRE